MALPINGFEWLPTVVDKVRSKHGVEPEQVESGLLNDDPSPDWHRVGEGKYLALCQEEEGGVYLFVVFAMPSPGIARIVTARQMDAKEKSLYRRRRGH